MRHAKHDTEAEPEAEAPTKPEEPKPKAAEKAEADTGAGATATLPAVPPADEEDDAVVRGALVRRVLGVAWFQLAGYVRSGQVLFPLVLLALIIAVQSGMPASPGASFADAASFALPVFALATHQLLGAEPDVQRAITAGNAGSRRTYLASGLLAALALNLCFLLLSTASALRGPLGAHVLVGGSVLTTILVGLAVHLLTYLPGVALGALTTRAVTGDAPAEYVALVGGLLIAVVPGLAGGPASWIALPLFRLLRAANGHRLELAAPGIALHVGIWTAVVTAAYLFVRLRRRSL